MASRTVIPRFLLPLQGPLWRGLHIPRSQNILVRFASSSSSSASSGGSGSGSSGDGEPIVLEKPARFNPPSHGSRLKRNALPRHYGPQLTAEDIAVQSRKNYPGLMAPEGSWAHFFWHSQLLHVFITMGTLVTLGIFTFFANYAYNSPFKELVPPISDLWNQPAYYFVSWKNVILMHERDKSARAVDHRTRHADDVAKRHYFMKMHGIEPKNPVTMTFGKGEGGPTEKELEALAMGRDEAQEAVGVEAEDQQQPPQKKKRFGVF